MPVLDGWLKNAQRAILGPRCLLCAAPALLSRELCDDCRQELPWLEHGCVHCALPLPSGSASDVCPACRRRARFDRGAAAFHYAAPVDWLITRLKFQGRLDHARLLGDLLAARLQTRALDTPEFLIPIPLHPSGLRRRGFNQAERIAARLAPALGCRIRRNALRRVRPTERQSTLAADRRAANVRDAFLAADSLDGAHVAIVDDVVTTGHTAMAAAGALRKAGAARIDLYCVARA